ncbi:hypothetical protein CXB51_035494 [Gossypium anomalum]|uniref:Cytochrome P450 n=1 Tax=Gossypium anomalum TaxID=47600 RepID=A0A8J6CFQ7_9ROSI|nr:hypothetical protein CXB51_035494 [Gossypium anomalum]
MGNVLNLFTASLCLCLFVALLYVLYKYWWVPHRVQFIMNSQGIRGPPYEFIHGNNKQALQMQKEASSKPMALTHDIFPRVMPYDYSCIKKYGENMLLGSISDFHEEILIKSFFLGKNYLSWNGVRAQLVITDPELVKEVLKNSEKAFSKPKTSYFFKKLLGDSIPTIKSEKWARHRKLANHAFHGESLKNMIPAMIASVGTMLEKWKDKEGKEMEVFQEFRFLTSEVISRTALMTMIINETLRLYPPLNGVVHSTMTLIYGEMMFIFSNQKGLPEGLPKLLAIMQLHLCPLDWDLELAFE